MAKFYCVIADEVTDYHSNQEILLLCVRCVDMLTEGVPCIKEIFLTFCIWKELQVMLLQLPFLVFLQNMVLMPPTKEGNHMMEHHQCQGSKMVHRQ